MISVQYINLDMTPSGILPVVYMSQYDVGRPIGLNVYSSGTAVELSGYTITIEATRTDGTAITTGVSISGNIAFFVTTATMTNKADKYNAQLILLDSNARRVGSIPMIFLVVPASMDEDAESIEEDRSLFQQYTETVMSEIAGIHNADNTMSAQIAQIVSRGGAVDIQHGFVNVSVEATSSAEFSVNFGHAFSTTPNVVCTVRHGSEGTQQIVKIKTITTTGFTGSVYNYHTIGTANTQVEWIAVTGLSDVNAEISDAHVGADGTTYESLGNAIRGQVTDLQEQIEDQATDFQEQIDDLEETIEGSSVAVNSFRTALLNCFKHVAWIDTTGPTYYESLYDALYNAPLMISAQFTQNGTVYTTDSLDSLRQYLVVTAHYEDGTTQTVTDYVLIGALTAGTSTITVEYMGKTTTFNVTVTADALSSISAVFAQNNNVITATDELNDLRPFLTVTASYISGTSETITNYALSGNLNSATSTITVTYSGKTTTFNVAVSMLPTGYTAKNYVLANGTQCITTTIPETAAKTWWFRHKETRDNYTNRLGHIFSSRNFYLPYLFATGAADEMRRVNANRYGLEWMNAGNTYWEWTINTEYTFESYKGGNDVYVNGELKGTLPLGETESASNMFAIFAWGGDPTSTRFYHSGKLFFLKAFNQDGTKVHDFVPCVNSSNVAGLYDLVDGTFYPPTAGTLATD